MKPPRPISQETARLWEKFQRMAEPYIRQANESYGQPDSNPEEIPEMEKAKPTWEYGARRAAHSVNNALFQLRNHGDAPIPWKNKRQQNSYNDNEDDDDLGESPESANSILQRLSGSNRNSAFQASFSAKRYVHNPSSNMYIQLSKADPLPIKPTRKIRHETAAGNPWEMIHGKDGEFTSQSVGYDDTGYNFEPSRARKKAERLGKGRGSHRPLNMPGKGRLEEGGENHNTEEFGQGELIRGTNKNKPVAKEQSLERAWIYGKNAKDTDGDGKADSTKIRDKISPQDKSAIEGLSNNQLLQMTEAGGTKMAKDFIQGGQSADPNSNLVQITKSESNPEMIAEMMGKQFGYSAKKVMDNIQSINKSVANLHALEHGDLFELHQNSFGSYLISPIGYGPEGELAVPVPVEYSADFETDIAKAKMRATINQNNEMRKSFSVLDSKHFYRKEMDTLFAKTYRFSKSMNKAGTPMSDSDMSTLHAVDDVHPTTESQTNAYRQANAVRNRQRRDAMSDEETLQSAEDPHPSTESLQDAYRRANEVRRRMRGTSGMSSTGGQSIPGMGKGGEWDNDAPRNNRPVPNNRANRLQINDKPQNNTPFENNRANMPRRNASPRNNTPFQNNLRNFTNSVDRKNSW